MDQEPTTVFAVEEASEAFIGRWNRLVSTTNWDKGRIIYEWRSALIAQSAPTTEFSDEAWSRLVGGVTGQHAGRLRRVYERFGDVHDQYEGLFWSHFQATLDWDDAEMWLEGALQSRWSVAEMRRQRWQTMGAVKEEEPRDDEVVASEVDEDFAPDASRDAANDNPVASYSADDYDAEPRSPAGPDFGDADGYESPRGATTGEAERESYDAANAPSAEPVEVVRPFAELPELPEDLAAAFESFQLAILRHKADEWRQISADDLITCLESLKELVRLDA
jgi:hypothetical protein